MADIEWAELKRHAADLAKAKFRAGEISRDDIKKLAFEFKEIDKQGAGTYWAQLYNDNHKYDTNKNGLVLPWILGMTSARPSEGEHQVVQQTDWPDIDLDCLPTARDPIKEYISNKYGDERVCSVGAWQTYKFKSAIQDVVRATGGDLSEAIRMTKELPQDVDDLKDGGYAKCSNEQCGIKHKDAICPKCGCEETEGITLGKLINEYEQLRIYHDLHPEVIELAVRMVGKIKALTKHAGGVIISSVPLFGRIPMGKSNGQNTSLWSEGRNTQLSKLGFVKWDVLGLKTLGYIYECCKLIEKTRGYKFAPDPWQDMDPEDNCVGWYHDADGRRHKVRMDDELVLEMINDLRTETIFQFETDVQRGVLSNGVRNFYDLQVFNAMGHPGPIAMIPDYVKRRDDHSESWHNDEHPDVVELLKDTYGLIVYQEQLQAMWAKFAGFTAPEAEAARKAVAKKWTHKLKDIEAKWMKGATKTLGEKWAKFYWDRMVTFGRYAFNKSHSCAYIVVAYWCAWLKVHFAPEWWASVMSNCHHDRIKTYMNVARYEGVKFGTINVENITADFTVDPETLLVTPGLTSIKGIGAKAADKLVGENKYRDIDHFIEVNGKAKTVMERLILLGSFKKYHDNIKATWMWYQYKYCTGKDITKLKREIRSKLLSDWDEQKIEEERNRQIAEYRKLYPNRRKIPNKILNWEPKPKDTRENVMALYPDDYTLSERLAFEKNYLGYYWHSPLDQYKVNKGTSIRDIKSGKSSNLECVVESFKITKTRNDKDMGRLVVTDGLQNATVFVWEDDLHKINPREVIPGKGIRVKVDYNASRDAISMNKDAAIIFLERVTEDSFKEDSTDAE